MSCIESPEVLCWEDPLTSHEKRVRLSLLFEKDLDKAEEELEHMRCVAKELSERCAALQVENEWLTTEGLGALCASFYVGQLVTRIVARDEMRERSRRQA